MIENMWFDTLLKPFCKMHFSWKLSMALKPIVTDVMTFLMDK